MKSGIFIISGPSGAGKGTITEGLLKIAALNLYWAKSYTTRRERASDKTEQKYIFVDENKFKELEKAGEIVESNFYNGHWYGTAKSEIKKALKRGQNVIKDVDVNGGKAYRKLYPKAVLIFITCPIANIKSRLEKRGQNSQAEIKERLRIAQKEMVLAEQYDYQVENPEGQPEKAIEQISQIIRSQIAAD